MSVKFSNIVKRFRKCESGATLVEYGIAITLAVGLGTGALMMLSGEIAGSMVEAGQTMQGTGVDPASITGFTAPAG